MYFLKKLTSFGKNVNVQGASADNFPADGPECKNQTEMDVEIPETVNDEEIAKGDVHSSSSSSLSIPDCFFDDVPETPSSDNPENASSEETDSLQDTSDDCDGVVRENMQCCIEGVTFDETKGKCEDETGETFDFQKTRKVESESYSNLTPDNIEEGCCLVPSFGCKTGTEGDGKINICSQPVDIDSDLGYNPIENLSYVLNLCKKNDDSKIGDDVCDIVNMISLNDDDQDCHFAGLESEHIDEYLDKENYEAEARLAARRQARVEAREIRLRELERQQKEQEENADRAFDMSYVADTILRTGRVTPSGTPINARDRSMATTNSYHSSRRSSEDSIEEGLTLRDIRHELKEAEEKFKKAMIANAQLDNEKSALAYQVELLKDRFEDLEESHAQLTREHRDKCREHEQLKRAAMKLKEDLEFYKINLLERDRLIADYGLVIVDGDEDGEGKPTRTLVSAQSAELLQQAGSGSLDVRLKKFSEDRNELLDEIRHLKLELEEERSKRIPDSKAGSLTNGPLDEETSKILSDYKFKLQKAEQDVSTLQANVARLESQVIRYKTAAESSEKAEDELKIEKRKLQRENRESIARIEELETANSHLQRRMDKLKNAKSTLLKEL